MEKTTVNKSILLTILFVIITTLLIISIPGKSQQNLYTHNVSININKDIENIPEQPARFYDERAFNKIINKFKLTPKEKELLKEIKQLASEAKQWLEEAEDVNKEVENLEKIIEISKPFKDIHSKAVRKATRYKEYEMALRYDAEEFLEMSSSLLFNVYENHIPTYEEILAGNFDNHQKIIELNKEAQELFKKAKKHQDKAYNDFNCKVGLQCLKKANTLELEALKKQELAFAMYFKIVDSGYEEPSELLANTTSQADEKTTRECNHDNNVEKEENTNIDEHNKPVKNNVAKNKIIFKVQVGAFVNNVKKEEFHGLSPLSADENNGFTKYMVGEYYSYKAACKSKEIIRNTTDYKDAFVVVYVNGKRIPVDVALSEYACNTQ